MDTKIRIKAVTQDRYGSAGQVMELKAIDMPEPAAGEVLVRVYASSVNPADWHLMRGVPYIARPQFGLRKPKHAVLGCDVAGRVEAAGRTVTAFQPGDEVFGNVFMRGFGAFAEYVCVPEDTLTIKPAKLSFEQAAAVPLAALTALQGLRDHGHVEPGQKVLIIGASGGVGTFAVQIAKLFGAEVTGVCSTRNLGMVLALGADHVIDYTKEDFTRSGQRYDLIFQLAGTCSAPDARRALTPKGTLILVSGESKGRWIGPVARVVKALLLSPFVSQTMATFTVKPSNADLEFLKESIEAGRVLPVVDRVYPLDRVPDAISYLEEGHAQGKVVISVVA